MPEPSTFRNHDPPRGHPAAEPERRARSPGDRPAPRRWPGASCAPGRPSPPGPACGIPHCSTRGRDRNSGGSRIRCCTACTDAIGAPVVLDEVEELDAVTDWPHPAWDIHAVCGAPALPHEGSELPTPGLRPFYDPRCPPASTRNPSSATFTPGWYLGSGDPAERGTQRGWWRHPFSGPPPVTDFPSHRQ